MPCETTRDGLIIYKLPRCGLAVSASEHCHKLSEWESERAALMAVFSAAANTLAANEVEAFHYDHLLELREAVKAYRLKHP